MPQLVTIRLNSLRCIAESDTNVGSEPYLWVTYFFVDGNRLTQPEPVVTYSPMLDRKEFPNNVRAGQVINVQDVINKFSEIVDPGAVNFRMVGCLVVLWEEDETSEEAIQAGHRAYSTAVHEALNNLIRERLRTLNLEAVTDEEVNAIRNAIEPKVESAIKSKVKIWEIFDNQDDIVGFSRVVFIGDELQTKEFEFPELVGPGSKNHYVLSGSLTVGRVPDVPPDRPRCAELRAAVHAQRHAIQALHTTIAQLQEQLQNAGPLEKPDIVRQISEATGEVPRAKEELERREAALKACEALPVPPVEA
jgi:hypothetical protein